MKLIKITLVSFLILFAGTTPAKHPHTSPPNLTGLKDKNLPKIDAILTIPLGPVTPSVELFIKGNNFGTLKGRVILQVSVDENGTFFSALKTIVLPVTRKGKRRIQLDVKAWSPTKIKVRVPWFGGVKDQQASLQVVRGKGFLQKTKTGIGSIGWKVSFYAARNVKVLKFGDAVISHKCSLNDDVGGCLWTKIKQTGPIGGPNCFSSMKLRKDKTISGAHMNCSTIGYDHGTDRYRIKLKNKFVIEKITWGMKRSSSNELVKLPKAKTLTNKHKGASSLLLKVPWEVSPGDDWLEYWINIAVRGPIGLPFK